MHLFKIEETFWNMDQLITAIPVGGGKVRLRFSDTRNIEISDEQFSVWLSTLKKSEPIRIPKQEPIPIPAKLPVLEIPPQIKQNTTTKRK